MARGNKCHLKRVNAPSHFMLDKLSGVFAPKVGSGPTRAKESIPLCVFLRNRLKLALNYSETKLICIARNVRVDGKIRTDHRFPLSNQSVIHLPKTNEHYRILFDTKGRLIPLKISPEEAKWKLCRVNKIIKGTNGISIGITNDGRSIRYLNPKVKVGDSLKFMIEENKVDYGNGNGDSVDGDGILSMKVGTLCMVTGGNSVGRCGVISGITKIPGFNKSLVNLTCISQSKSTPKDTSSNNQLDPHFTTLINNVMVIGMGDKKWVSLLKSGGIRNDINEDRRRRMKK